METESVVISSIHDFKQNRARAYRRGWTEELMFRLSKHSVRVYDPAFTTIPMTKYSPLFDIFNPLILRLQAGGIIEQNAKFYYLDYNQVKDKTELRPIELEHMLTGMFGIGIGLAMATAAFSIEMMSSRWRLKKRTNRIRYE